MSLNKLLPTAAFVSLFSIVAAAPALADASFSLSPSSGVCVPDGTFEVDIILTSDVEIGGATAIIEYDPSLLKAVSLTNGDIFPFELANSIDSSAGRLRLDAGVDFANPDNHTGSGTFGVIKFEALQVGGASPSFDFTLGSTTDSNAADAETHDDALTSTSGGSYTFEEGNDDPSLDPSCVSGGEPTPTPEFTPTPEVPTPLTTPPGNGGGDTAPTPAPAGSAGNGGEAPGGGILGPTVFISLLSLILVGAGLAL